MHFRKLDLNLLVALDALIRLQSVSLAAEELHLSQSAMSHSLSRLRAYFNDDILMKVGRNMMLTALAEQLEHPIRDILIRIDASIMMKPGFDPALSDREFRICVSDYILNTLIPYVLEVASEQGSKVKMNFLPQVSDPKKELDRGSADLLIVPDVFCSEDQPSETLLTDEFACIVWNQNPLAQQGLTRESFLVSSHVCMQPPHSDLSFEGYCFEKMGIKRQVEVLTYSFSSIPNLIEGTNRIATVQKKLIKKAISQGAELTSLAAPVELPALQESMQWSRYQNTDLGMIWLRELMREAARRL
ncbi:Nodulation protein D 2 [Marinomonas spartinae]|uniref:Nodulation protein D 2 n=1 Tax=Marinomonas spartinae TaxID=1792290 RepID=A0A1A8TUS2_9GAMM|nr:LysR family transcriptional regulator [Marinomonas spartinae]SBS29492.1 Nodulation protein D 2 [Marinomonas spartinae]SBS37011.1 Nodulation protein D 2 [Marinomonas spartinae]